MNSTRILWAIGIALAGMSSFVKAVSLPDHYLVTDLGVISGADSSTAIAINDLGQVTGDSGNHVFLWTPQTGMQDLGAAGGFYDSAGVGINNSGQIAVFAQPATYPPFIARAYRWNAGVFQDLGTLGGTLSSAYGIDASGRVTGYSYTSSGDIHAYRSTTGNSLIDIDSMGGNYSLGYGINASGQVVGQAYNALQQYHAFLWPGSGNMQDLGTLGGTQSQANDISDSGIIVGDSSTTNNAAYHAFILQNGVMTDLGSLTLFSSYGNAVNNLAQVVGVYSDSNFDHPYAWSSQTGMRDLNTMLDPVTGLGWILDDANDINNVGQIVGQGFHNGSLHGYLLTPVPEPTAATLCLVATTLTAIRPSRRRPC